MNTVSNTILHLLQERKEELESARELLERTQRVTPENKHGIDAARALVGIIEADIKTFMAVNSISA